MAAYATDSKGREFIAIVTVEQRSQSVQSIELFDVTHSVSGRQKRNSQASTKLQGVIPIKAVSEISIADLLEIVKNTYQSILSEDVLSHFEETRNPDGYYADRVLFSAEDQEAEYSTEDDAETESREEALEEAGVSLEVLRELEAKGIVRVLPNKKDRQQIKAEKKQKKAERRQRLLDAKAEADRRMKRRGKAKPEEEKVLSRKIVQAILQSGRKNDK